MTTLDIIAALLIAVKTNDAAATARLLAELDVRLPVEEQLDLLESIFGAELAAGAALAVTAPFPVSCA
jgi:hypothetical protein